MLNRKRGLHVTVLSHAALGGALAVIFLLYCVPLPMAWGAVTVEDLRCEYLEDPQGIDATEASTYMNLMPLVTLAAAAGMLGERISALQITGGLLVIAGVYGMGRTSRRPGR